MHAAWWGRYISRDNKQYPKMSVLNVCMAFFYDRTAPKKIMSVFLKAEKKSTEVEMVYVIKPKEGIWAQASEFDFEMQHAV
jgi:hypothetical protein